MHTNIEILVKFYIFLLFLLLLILPKQNIDLIDWLIDGFYKQYISKTKPEIKLNNIKLIYIYAY